jgi:Ca2+-binding RTX toxin-like protein
MNNNARTKSFGPGADIIDLRLPQGAFGAEGFFDNAEAGGGNDTVQGNGADNVLDGGSGNDRMLGDLGHDTMRGGTGNDRMLGEFGRDSLSGGDGADTLDGGLDNDTLSGGAGNDRLLGDFGNDLMRGDAGNDRMEGGAGRDTLHGGTGNDDMRGGFDNDVMKGDAGNDTLRGEDGGDRLEGGAGNDVIHTDASGQLLSDNDIARGGDGNDTIHSHTGVDQLFGDAGNDLFFYNDLLSNRMLTRQVTVDGGTGSDTVVLNGQVLPVVNIGAEAEPVLRMWDAFAGIERIDIERDAGNQTLTFGQGDVRRMSDTDVLTLDGGVGDHVHLFAIPTGDILEGNWVRRADQAIGGETFAVYDFELFGPEGSIARVRIDSDIGVSLF